MKKNAKKLILIAMTVFLSMIFIDETGVAVTLPSIQSSLMLANIDVQWVMNGMFLSLAVLVLGSGKLADHIGYRRVFTWGVFVFLIASLVCAFSHSGSTLIFGRVLQGISASMMIATYAVLISLIFPENERGIALGTCASIASIFLATGPFIGGALAHYLSWRGIFLINIPIGLLCLYFVYQCIEKDKIQVDVSNRFDYVGFTLFTTGFTALIYAFMQAINFGWGSSFIVCLFCAAAILLTAFITFERRKKNPLVHLSLFKNRHFFAGNIILLCTQVVVMSLTYWAIWLQLSLHFSPLMAGIGLLPAGLPILITARWGGALLDKFGPRRPITIGTTIVLIGMIWIVATAHFENYWLAMIGFLAYGIGAPFIISPAIATVLGSVEANARGMASGILNTMRQLGASLCFAIVGVVITNLNTTDQKNYTAAFTYGMCVTALFAFIACYFAYRFLKTNK